MSTSLLYHGFGIRGYQYRRTTYAEGTVMFTLRSYTNAFARYLLDLRRSMTIADISRHVGVGWGIIKDIEKRYLEGHFARPKLKHLRKIAIRFVSKTSLFVYARAPLCLFSSFRLSVQAGKIERRVVLIPDTDHEVCSNNIKIRIRLRFGHTNKIN